MAFGLGAFTLLSRVSGRRRPRSSSVMEHKFAPVGQRGGAAEVSEVAATPADERGRPRAGLGLGGGHALRNCISSVDEEGEKKERERAGLGSEVECELCAVVEGRRGVGARHPAVEKEEERLTLTST